MGFDPNADDRNSSETAPVGAREGPVEIQSLLAEFSKILEHSFRPTPQASASLRDQAPTLPDTIPTVEDRYRVLVEQIPAVVFMAFVDGGMSEAYVSPQVEHVLGFSREEWLDDPIRWYYQIHPDDRQRWSVEAAQMFLTGAPLKNVYRVMARDGRVVWFRCEVKLVRRKDGQPWFIHGVGFDITDLKRTEKALEEETAERERLQRLELERQIEKTQRTESRLAAIVECSEDAIVSKDLNGVITTWNKSAELMFGWSAQEAIGQNITLIIPRDRQDEENSILVRLKNGEQIEHFETVRTRKDGTPLDVSVSISPLPDAEGRVIGASKVARNITAKKRAEKELAEAARRQKALFHLADQLHRAPSLDDVYNAALDAIFSALRCDRASILLCDENGAMQFVRWQGLSESYRTTVQGHSAWPADEPNPQPVCICDIDTADLNDSLKRALKEEGIGALAFIPLISSGRLSGKFMAYFNTPHLFVDDEIDLGFTIARQLAFGIDRKRAEEAVRQGAARESAEADALAKLNLSSSRLWRIQSQEEGLKEMLAAVIALLGADKGNIQLLDAETNSLTIAVQQGFDQGFLDFFRKVSAQDDSACGRALRLQRPVVIEDIASDEAFAPFRAIALASNFQSVVSCPLTKADGTPIGMISVHFSQPHRPTEQDLRRLDLYVRQAADFVQRIRIENALRQSEEQLRVLADNLDSEVRLRTRELEERNADVLRQSEQLRTLSFRLLKSQDDERRRIARDLHDSAGQILAALGISVAQVIQDVKKKAPEIAKHAEGAQQLIQELTQDIRTTSYLLHPPLLDDAGLSAALGWYIQGLEPRSGLDIELSIPECFGRLPSDMELVIFRLIQECLTNVHRHARSKSARICVSRQPETVSVEIQDHGQGMSPERLAEIRSHGSGVGINGIRERLRQFQGELNIESTSSGTLIKVTIPIPKEASSHGPEIRPYQAAG